MDDCIIIGAGPAGLTAAIYLARFHLAIRLFDCGSSRAAQIPCTRNHAGFPDGISGKELLGRMLAQAERHGAVREGAEVTGLGRIGSGFGVRVGTRALAARTVLLATGVVNHRPDMPAALHDAALARGLLRYCPICDGYEVTDKRIGVIGTGGHGMREAMFLRAYSADVTLIAPQAHALSAEEAGMLDAAGIARVEGPCGGHAIEGDRIALDTASGRMAFDSIYPALGSTSRWERVPRSGRASADLGPRPVRRGRRRARARPDQPCDGRGRCRRHRDPQPARRAAPHAALTHRSGSGPIRNLFGITYLRGVRPQG